MSETYVGSVSCAHWGVQPLTNPYGALHYSIQWGIFEVPAANDSFWNP